MRLIDADALLEQYGLKDATKYGNKTSKQQEHSYSTMMMYEIADMIEDSPTAYDIDKVVAELVKQAKEIHGNVGMGGEMVVNLDDVIKIVKQEEEKYNNGWILVSERSPEDRQPVIVCATGKDEGVFISYYVEELKAWRYDTDEGIHYYVDVIAWQPLPEPYQPKGE